MAPLVILAFESIDSSGGSVWTYRAYSSNDPGRSVAKLQRDVFIHVGYQECNEEDNMTPYGRLRHFHAGACDASFADRSQGIYFVRQSETNHKVNDNHSIVARDNRGRLVDEDADNDLITLCDHFMAPEFNIPGYDEEDVGNGSDSD